VIKDKYPEVFVDVVETNPDVNKMKDDDAKKSATSDYHFVTDEEFEGYKTYIREKHPDFTEEDVERRARFFVRMGGGY